jgi:hypothetical protein
MSSKPGYVSRTRSLDAALGLWVGHGKQKTKGPGATPGPSDLCVTLSCQPPLLVPPPLEPMPLLAPLLVLPPLLVLGVLMPDAEVPVLGLVAVPGLFSEGNAAFGL